MTEQDIKNMEIPVLKKDAKVQIEIGYQEAAAIAQTFFIIAGKWDEATKNEFKTLIDKREQINNPEMITYIILDQLYRKLLQKAKDEDQVEMTKLSEAMTAK
jgi:hypothetical protein